MLSLSLLHQEHISILLDDSSPLVRHALLATNFDRLLALLGPRDGVIWGWIGGEGEGGRWGHFSAFTIRNERRTMHLIYIYVCFFLFPIPCLPIVLALRNLQIYAYSQLPNFTPTLSFSYYPVFSRYPCSGRITAFSVSPTFRLLECPCRFLRFNAGAK